MKINVIIIFSIILALNSSCSDNVHNGELNIRDFHSKDIPIITTVDSLERIFGKVDRVYIYRFNRYKQNGEFDYKDSCEIISYIRKGIEYIKKEDSVQLFRISFRNPYSTNYTIYHKKKCINRETKLNELIKYLNIKDYPLDYPSMGNFTMNGDFYEGYSFGRYCKHDSSEHIWFRFDLKKIVEIEFYCDNGGILSIE